MLGALYATTLFFSIINATVIQPVIAAERAVSYRERAAGMYSVLPFTLALVSTKLSVFRKPLSCSNVQTLLNVFSLRDDTQHCWQKIKSHLPMCAILQYCCSSHHVCVSILLSLA